MENTSRRPPRALLAYVVVLVAPPLAWVVWVARTGRPASDAGHVAWFVTVAVGCVVAGAVGGRRTSYRGPALVAVASTLVTLWLWWSSEDETGLFVVGILLAAPLVVLASVPLLLLGRVLGSRGHVSE